MSTKQRRWSQHSSSEKGSAMPASEQPTSDSAAAAQTTRDAFWTAAELGTALMKLDRQECLELLAANPWAGSRTSLITVPEYCLSTTSSPRTPSSFVRFPTAR